MLSLVQSDRFRPAPNHFNMAAYVLAQSDRLADKPALQIVGSDGSDEVFGFAALKRAVLGTATGFLEHAKPGDRIILQLGNTPEFPIAFLGAIAAGIVPVSLSSALSETEYAGVVQDVSPTLQVRRKQTSHAIRLTRCATSGPVPHQISLTAIPIGLPYIIYTSGTTGRPMPVLHAHRAIWARRMMWDGWYGLRETDRMMHAGAFNWTYTLGTGLMDPWAKGATALIPAEGVTADQLPAIDGKP